MKKIALLAILLFASVAIAGPPTAPPNFSREYTLTAGETVGEQYLYMYTLTNYGATGTIEFTLPTPAKFCDFTVWAAAAQVVQVDFPTDANPYLNGAQIGANHELVIPAGGVLRIVYFPSTATWHAYMVHLVTTEQADD